MTDGQEADGHARLAPGRLAQRPQHRRRVDGGAVFGIATTATKPPAAAARVPESRSSLCSWPGHAQVHVRVDEAREQVAALAVDRPRRRRGASEPGAPSSAISPPRTSTSCGASIPLRGSSTWAPRTSRSAGGGAVARSSGSRAAPASRPASRARRRSRAPGQQLVEHRHPHDDAGRDLLADHRLRRVDHLGGELDAAVDRAGVHEHLARAEPAAVDLVARRVLAQRRARSESVMRSRCIRSA